MRGLRSIVWVVFAMLNMFSMAPAARSTTRQVWLFDHAPSYPGVTMMEVARHGATAIGSVTTRWYGPIAMRNARWSGATLSFDVRNLNDPQYLTRRWTAHFSGKSVMLVGDLWHSHVEQRGHTGTTRDAATRAFHVASALPPLGTIPPDNLAPTPPMGWSSWNKFADRIDDRTIRAMADAMVATGLRDAGYRFINIDDGWQGERDADGVLHPNARFPNMKALADYVHARGLKLGLYTSPGPKTCAGYAGSYGHVEQDARNFAAWGIDYLKYDLCSGEWFYADADSVKRAYYQMGLALKATGRPIVYALCEYGRFDVSLWGAQVGGHLWRTTGDITDDYATMADIGFDRNPKHPHLAAGSWNDPDMLEVGNGGMTEDEYRTHITLWAMQAAPLIMGHDLRLTTPAAKHILGDRAIIAVDQDPQGMQGKLIRSTGTVEIWRKELADGSVALALFNRGASPAEANVTAMDAGIRELKTVTDLWTGAASTTSDIIDLPPHGVRLLHAKQ